MKYKLATIEECNLIYQLVQETIKTIYPKYYPAEVVDFFINHHNLYAIKNDIKSGNVGVLIVNDKIVGTGCYINNHITRVYVLPEYQGNGYGTFIMNQLELIIKTNHNNVFLDASLPAAGLYEKLGFIKTGEITHESKYTFYDGTLTSSKYEMDKKLYLKKWK